MTTVSTDVPVFEARSISKRFAAVQALDDPSAARVLVGGLGMGFTLARTLELVGTNGMGRIVHREAARLRGAGGGAIRLDVGGTLQVDGTITAGGSSGATYGNDWAGGGGSGGGRASAHRVGATEQHTHRLPERCGPDGARASLGRSRDPADRRHRAFSGHDLCATGGSS